MTAIELVEADPQGLEAMALLREAAEEARRLYPEFFGPTAPDPTNAPNLDRGVYLIARRDGCVVGMGAHRPLDAECTEIRRLFVTAGARRLGVARFIMSALEQHAEACGFRRLVLETGNRQVPAMRLYERLGFVRIAAFGAYIGDPTSVCYAKPLSTRRGPQPD